MIKSAIMDFADVKLFQEFSASLDAGRESQFVKVPFYRGYAKTLKYKMSREGVRYETEAYVEVKYNAYDLKHNRYVRFEDTAEVKVVYTKEGRE